jgi:hypothetical protein
MVKELERTCAYRKLYPYCDIRDYEGYMLKAETARSDALDSSESQKVKII